MKIGDKVLYKKKENMAYVKGFIVDYLSSVNMVSFDASEYGEPVYYFNVNDFDIVVIKESKL